MGRKNLDPALQHIAAVSAQQLEMVELRLAPPSYLVLQAGCAACGYVALFSLGSVLDSIGEGEDNG